MRAQTNLYRRHATYYWGRAIPITAQPILGPRDLRLSLRSNIPAEARKRTRRINAAFDLLLQELEQIVADDGTILPETAQAIVRQVLLATISGLSTATSPGLHLDSTARCWPATALRARRRGKFRTSGCRNPTVMGSPRPYFDCSSTGNPLGLWSVERTAILIFGYLFLA
jgi:hypothetical protein